MVGGRKTHEFPNGRPLPLTLLTLSYAAVVLLTIAFVHPSGGFRQFLPSVTALVAIALAHRKLMVYYERIGKAVPVPCSVVVVKYPNGLPVTIIALRVAFFGVVGMMLFFGLAPVADKTARVGIIYSIFVLIAIAVAYIAVERRYVRIGRADEAKVVVYPKQTP